MLSVQDMQGMKSKQILSIFKQKRYNLLNNTSKGDINAQLLVYCYL
jgi:hypothetical protein